jgi:hypothetical protein
MELDGSALAFLAVVIFLVEPFALAFGLGLIQLPWLATPPLIASAPVILLTWLFSTPGDIANLGTPLIVFLVVIGWLLGAL